jgi:hypothetical protein
MGNGLWRDDEKYVSLKLFFVEKIENMYVMV